MKTWVHSLVSFILALVLYPIFGWEAVLILAGGILIDFDHYIRFMFKYKNLSIFECYRHYILMFKKNNFDECNDGLFIFHTIEFAIVIAILSFFNRLAMIFAIGLLAHYLLDLIWHMHVPRRIVANHSLISWILKQKF
ncbi:hypothetical protein HYW20_03900 [Candidatus Woesearchaeota archaeon]|nr:hypothetical protein [Candidatus Woesearchaeota archaeon]